MPKGRKRKSSGATKPPSEAKESLSSHQPSGSEHEVDAPARSLPDTTPPEDANATPTKDQDGSLESQVLPHLICFVDGSSSSRKRSKDEVSVVDKADDNEKIDAAGTREAGSSSGTSFEDSVSYLVNHLQVRLRSDANDKGNMLKEDDQRLHQELPSQQQGFFLAETAQMLLAWVVRQMTRVRGKNDEWHARVLHVSFHALAAFHQDPQACLPAVLTHGTLLRLVPQLLEATLLQAAQAQTQNEETPPPAKKAKQEHQQNECSDYSARMFMTLLGRPLEGAGQEHQTKSFVEFHPTLEMAIGKVLQPVVAAAINGATEVMSIQLTTAALGWILNTLLPRGNPKSNFQQLIKPSFLEALSRLHQDVYHHHQGWNADATDGSALVKEQLCLEGRSLVGQVLASGLVDAQQHLDGLSSLLLLRAKHNLQQDQKSAKFKSRSFYMDLLSLFDRQQTATFVPILPVLYDQFLEQLQHQYGLTTRKGQATTVAPFALFEIMTAPLLRALSQPSENDLPCAEALRQLTSLLLVHKVYVAAAPAQQDNVSLELHSAQTRFLERMVPALVSAKDGDEKRRELIETLTTLLQLNHQVFHNRLVQVLQFVFSSASTSGQTAMIVSRERFVERLAETYQKLRQQTTLVKSLLQVFPLLSEQGLVLWDECRQRSAVTAALVQTVARSPIQQVQDVFGTLESWFLDACSGKKEISAGAEDEGKGLHPAAFSAAVGLATLLFQSIGVEQATASTVSDLVHHFCNAVVDPMSSVSSAQGMQAAMSLCAWLIHLQQRCVFWLGQNHATLQLPAVVEAEVKRQVDRAGTKKDDAIEEALLLLVSHRLQQIVSLVHDEQLARITRTNHDNEINLEPIHAEGKQLAALLSVCADHSTAASDATYRRSQWRADWTEVAKCVHAWVVYATDQAIDQFVACLFSSLTSPNPGSTKSEDEQRGREVAIALLQDVSFLDISRIGRKLHWGAVVDASRWVCRALARSGGQPKCDDPEDCWSHLSSSSSPPLDSTFLKALSTSVNWSNVAEAVRADSAMENNVARWTSSLQAVSSLPLSLLAAGDMRKFFKALVILEWAAVSCLDATSEHKHILDWVTASRHALAVTFGLMNERPAEHTSTRVGSLACQFLFMEHIIVSTGIALQGVSHDHHEHKNEARTMEFLSSTEALLSRVSFHLVQKREFVAALQTKGKILSTSEMPWSKHAPALNSALTAKSILCGVNWAHEKQLLDLGTSQETSSFLLDLWRRCWESCCTLNDLQHESSASSIGFAQRFRHLLQGDLLRTHKQWGIPGQSAALERMCEMIRQDLSHPRTSDMRQTLHYSLACLVRVRPSASLAALLVKEMSTIFSLETPSIAPNHILGAAYCDLIQCLDGASVNFGGLFCWKDESHPTGCQMPVTAKVRLATLILQNTRPEEDTEGGTADATALPSVLREHGAEIFELSLSSLQPPQSTGDQDLRDSIIVDSLRLLCALIRRRDVYALRESDPAIILSRLNAVCGSFRLDGRARSSDRSQQTSAAVFMGCVKALDLLLQSRPKQLYGCAPSVISLMYSFLICCMDATNNGQRQPDNSVDIAVRSNEFCRLCEIVVAHREVYKKHVVGLVLEFVHRLNNQNTPPAIKNALLPAIHCLLDMFTHHETGQLNALMQRKDKPTFGPIYKRYQKHAYKGQ